jgi:excisionase family DNA binding protein
LKHNSSTETAKPYISQAEAGTYLGVTDRTIRSMISRGILPAYALGRTIRLKRSEIDAGSGITGCSIGGSADISTRRSRR